MLWFWSLPSIHRRLSFTIVKYSCYVQDLFFYVVLVIYCFDPYLKLFNHKLFLDFNLQNCRSSLQKLHNLGRQTILEDLNCTTQENRPYSSSKTMKLWYTSWPWDRKQFLIWFVVCFFKCHNKLLFFLPISGHCFSESMCMFIFPFACWYSTLDFH